MNNTTFLKWAYFEGSLVPFEQANISIATHALHYGTAAFGGLRGVINPANKDEVILFRLDKHAKRLRSSSLFLGHDISEESIKQAILDFVIKNKPTNDFYIRPLIYVSDLGISPKLHDNTKDLLIYGLEFGNYLPDSISCCISSWIRQEDRAMPLRGKISGGYINSALAKTEAINRGFDEAIMMNTQGKVSEGSAMNLFLVRDNVLITPSVNQDILEGITRDSVLHIANQIGLQTEIRPVDKSELFIADEVFLTGTAARITPVHAIEQFTLPSAKPITSKLKDILTTINLGEDSSYERWLTRISTV